MSNPWTPGPWVWADAHGSIRSNASDHLRASGNRLVLDGRSRRAIANRAVLAAATEMAEVLECLAQMAPHFPSVKTYGNRPTSGSIYSVSGLRLGEAAITVEDLHRARAILTRIRGEQT